MPLLTLLIAQAAVAHQSSASSFLGTVGRVVAAQTPPDPQNPRRRNPQNPAGQTPPAGGTPPQAQPKTPEKEVPFEEAVKDYEKSEGVINTYRKGDSVLFDIPAKTFGRDFLWIVELENTPAGGYNGSTAGELLFRFEKKDDKILLRGVDYSVRATHGKEIKLALEQSNVQPIIAAFDPKAKGKGGDTLIDVTRLFKGELPELRYGSQVGGNAMDPGRSFVEKVDSFPDNVNVEVTATFTGPGGVSFNGFSISRSNPSNTALIHHSITVLPEKPMQPRLGDSRVGYFSTSFTDFGIEQNGTKEYRFIDRYRLEKKDPTAALSEPVKQIVYYIAPEVPKEWHAALKKGVEDWNEAFEQAGFKNAIVCREAPTKQEDPKWSPDDTRYSVIRWAPLQVKNAMGPHVSDPRTGEILSAHIIVWHDVLQLAEEWYFAQASPNDPRAQHIPLPKDVMDEALEFVVCHEVGHTLGLPHNGKASAMVPTKMLRDKAWTARNGTAYSIMDYARFNYVAQPGDGVRLVPRLGDYDRFSIMWGYKPIAGANNPMDEKGTLDSWAAQQVTNPALRFYDNFTDVDPTAQSEALGDDAVVASNYGVMNLKRVMGFLVPATTKTGEDYSQLGRFYGAVWSQFQRYVGHVITMVGGVVQTDYHAGRGGNVYSPVPRDRQKAAVKWIADNVFTTPSFMMPSDIAYKLGPTGISASLQGAQRRAISGLLQNSRFGRLLENEQVNGAAAYSAGELMGDLRAAILTEVSQQSPRIDLYRRDLQRTYINALIGTLGGASSEERGFATAELRADLGLIRKAQPRAADLATAAHLSDLDTMIAQALTNPPTLASTASSGGFPFGGSDVEDGSDFCGATYRVGKM